MIDAAVAEAAQRFGIPARWIELVMQAESARNPRAVSRAGAIGLMQLMPLTYAELQRRYSLGADPFAIRDNILAGAAYLRELRDRYGVRGMLAAYNAGPRRWEQHLGAGRPLPRETAAYLARLAPRIAPTTGSQPRAGNEGTAPSALGAPIFVARAAPALQRTRASGGQSMRDEDANKRLADTLFVRRSGGAHAAPRPNSVTLRSAARPDQKSNGQARMLQIIIPLPGQLFVDANSRR